MFVSRARRWRAIVVLLAAVVAQLVTVARPVLAAGRHSSLVMDVNSGQILHSIAADEPRYPASLTKIMTLYLVFELLEQGKLTLATRVRVSSHAASQAPSRLGLEAGSEITVGEIIRALIVKSANDMAVAIAEHIAGSEERFAQLMTAKARQLGMSATTFRNASGLPDGGQVTTARDMATLALKLMDNFPRYYPLFSTRVFAYGGSMHRNHNTLLGTFEGTDGIKTGYTSASGFNLVASVRRDGKHVVGIYFGGQTAAVRNAHMKVLITRAFPRASRENTRRALIASARRPQVPVPKTKTAVAPDVVAPAPVPAVRPPVARTVWTAPKSAAAPAPAASEAADGAPVALAKVRRVAILPRGAAPAPKAAPTVTGSLGAQPSTLTAQAARINQGQAPVASSGQAPHVVAALPPAYHLKGTGQGSAAPSVSPGGGSIGIQIGAYASEAEARRQLQSVQARAAAVVAGRQVQAHAANANGRTLYRARFVGFDAAAATSACNELRRLQIDCLVTRTD